MKLEYGFLRKKVASRVVLLFFLSALVPIAATALFSITYVTDLLVDQSYRRLQHASKLYGMALLDRLQIIDDELRKATAELSKVKNIKETIDADSPDPVTAILNGIRQKKQIDKLTIEFISVSNLISEGYDESQSDKSILFNAVNSAGARKVYLRRIIAAGQSDKMITLLAELNNRYLWGEQETLPFSTYLCVLGGGHTILFCPQQDHDALLAGLDASPQKYEPIKMKWSNRNGDNLAVSWDFFIQSGFSGPSWKILSSMPETDALLPVYAFHRIYPIVILFSLLVVLLLSLIQVRKTMVPLQRLVSATRRLANYEFGEAVKVNSNDEFAALADSFNVMAVRLEKQFNELKIFSEIDRLILTYSDLNVVLARIFDTAHLIVSSDIIGITLLDKNETTNGDAYVKELATGKLTHTENALIPETEAAKLLVEEAALSVDMKTQSWHILEPLHNCDVAVAQVYRILLDGKLRGIFCLGYRAETADVAEDSGYVRGIIDRLAVALATADRDEKLYYQANFDHLTGLPNRQLFNDRLERHIIQARRKKERAALLYIDLDRFKNINDSLGHASGDKLLWEVANRMKRCIRETDTLSRLGGDEFVIVLSSVSSPKDAGNIAENIIHSISKPLHISAREIFINASIGIVVYPEDGKNNKELISHADAAMYRAKESGRGRYMFFEESMNKEIVKRMEMETAMRYALQREEFSLYYQPQVELQSGKVTAVEALIRWNHPELGLLNPKHFIPLAEECGLIEQIGEWLLHAACKQYQTWRDLHIAPEKLAINISSRQFMQANFIDVINDAISSTGMTPGELEMEITESLLMDERINTKSMFGELEALGVNLAIDDFGTGYSSLSYLKRFPVNILKIDRVFTQDIPTDKQVTTLTLSIIAMAHALNMEVVAEGIETREQLDVLRANKCDYIQGYYFSRPLAADEVTRYLTQQREGILLQGKNYA